MRKTNQHFNFYFNFIFTAKKVTVPIDWSNWLLCRKFCQICTILKQLLNMNRFIAEFIFFRFFSTESKFKSDFNKRMVFQPQLSRIAGSLWEFLFVLFSFEILKINMNKMPVFSHFN